MTGPDDRDPLEERLRDALHARAHDVVPHGDGLARIRERVAGRPWWRRRLAMWVASPVLAAAGSVAVVTLAVAAVGVGRSTGVTIPLTPDQPPATSAGFTSAPAASVSRSADSAPATTGGATRSRTRSPAPTSQRPSAPPPAASPTKVTVPVYYVTRSGGDYELNQTTRTVKLTGDVAEQQTTRAEAALHAMYQAPDIQASSVPLWQPGTTVLGTELDGGTLVVDLSPAGDTGATDSGEGAQAALQQLVYTGLGAAPEADAVRLTVQGQPVTRFWGEVPLDADGLQRGDPALARPLNAITAPDPDAAVTSPVTVSGTGSYADGTVHWEVLSTDQVVRSGTASTGTTGFGDWSVQVNLDPGAYTVTTFEQPPSGERHNPDSRDFTVTG